MKTADILLSSFISASTSALGKLYDSREARAMVSILLKETLGIGSYDHIVNPSRELSVEESSRLGQAVERMAQGEPLQYVLGYADFCSRRFNVTPDVLIPRPETEYLCSLVIEELPKDRPLRILDLCTGSGCIAWTMALSLPLSRVTAVDISEDALRIASSQNFECGRIEFIRDDALKLSSVTGSFDVIMSNPPYVCLGEKGLMRKNVLDFEPHLALFVPDDDPLRFYIAIAEQLKRLMPVSGKGYLETNEAFCNDVAGIFTRSGCTEVRVERDFSGKKRFVFFAKNAD